MDNAAAGASTRITIDYEPALATIWLTLPVKPLPCITPALIDDFCSVAEALRREHGRETPSGDQPYKFLVVRSASERVFSLGGDLVSMTETIESNRIDVLDRTAVGGARPRSTWRPDSAAASSRSRSCADAPSAVGSRPHDAATS